jgi:hypothetical protein
LLPGRLPGSAQRQMCALQPRIRTLAFKRQAGYSLTMTELLDRAFTEAAKLPAKEQDAMAALLLEELASERRWEAAFASSPHPPSEMAREALREFEAGKTRPMDADRDLTHQ